MSWIAISLMSAAVSGLVSIFDKTVIYRYTRTPETLPLLISLFAMASGLVVLVIVRIPADAKWDAIGAAVLSGVLFGLNGQLMLRVLYTREVSRTVPVTQSAPIFAAVLALIFLHESISAVQWTAIIGIVIGSALISMRFKGSVAGTFLHRSFYPLMLAAFFTGTAHVVGKFALDDLPILFTHGLRLFVLGLVLFVFSFRSEAWADLRAYFKQRSPALLFVGANELVIANVGGLLLLWALSEGPASLVTALTGSKALFVVLYSTSLAIVWRGALGEQTSFGAVAIKAGSTVLIVAGVVTIAA